MKKRPLPIPLIAAVALCFVIVGYINYKTGPQPKDDPKPPSPPPVESKALADPRKAPSKDEIRSQVNLGGPGPSRAVPIPGGPGSAPGGPPGPTAGGTPPGGPRPGGPEGGMIPLPGKGLTKPPKPKPNESAISTQWYTPEANSGSKN